MKRSKRKWQKESKLIKLRERLVLLWIGSTIGTVVMTFNKRVLREAKKEHVQNEVKKNQSSSA